MADHREVERALRAAGWTDGGAGDWAIALRSPDGTRAARISPFDPTGPYAAALYREAAHTRQVPALVEHRRLAGARIRENQRRFMTEIPLTYSGPWDPREREAMRAALAAADARAAAT